LGGFVLSAFAGAAACNLNSSGQAEEAVDSGVDATMMPDTNPPPPVDAGVDVDIDAPPDTFVAVDANDACMPTSFTCNGQCVSSCAGCAAGNTLCPTTRACGHCNGCAGFDIECFSCTEAGAASSFCGQTNGLRCGSAPHCACAGGDAGACPGASQGCDNQGDCVACGEAEAQGLPCAGGGICAGGNSPPACTPDGG
jgi:hypothetical protein